MSERAEKRKVAKACAELAAGIDAVPYDLPAFAVLVGLHYGGILSAEDIASLEDDAVKYGSGKMLLKELLRSPVTRELVLGLFLEFKAQEDIA